VRLVRSREFNFSPESGTLLCRKAGEKWAASGGCSVALEKVEKKWEEMGKNGQRSTKIDKKIGKNSIIMNMLAASSSDLCASFAWAAV